MTDVRGINRQASYANKHSIIVSDVVRLIFIDERHYLGRVDSIVSEVVMTKETAVRLANEIHATLVPTPAETPEMTNGVFQPAR